MWHQSKTDYYDIIDRENKGKPNSGKKFKYSTL